MITARVAMMVAVAMLAQAACAGETSADIVIYGSSPAAIAAAVQAKRMGAKAGMFADDFEGTVDGVHPNDWGAMSLARAYGKAVKTALGLDKREQ